MTSWASQKISQTIEIYITSITRGNKKKNVIKIG